MPLAGEFAYSRLISGSVVGEDPSKITHRRAGLIDLGIPRDRMHTTQGVYLPDAHNGMVRELLKHRDWDGVVWCEHDHQFDWHFVERVESYDKPIVGIPYYTRELSDPRMMVAKFANQEDPSATDPPYKIQYLMASEALELINNPGLHEVDFVPHGMTFVSREVYETLPDPWYVAGDAKELGDDVYFIAQARKAGFKVFADSLLWSGHLTLGISDRWWYVRELRRRFLELNFGHLLPAELGGPNSAAFLPEGLPEIISELKERQQSIQPSDQPLSAVS